MKQFILQFAFAILIELTNKNKTNSFEDFNAANLSFFNGMKSMKLNSLITTARSYSFNNSDISFGSFLGF